MALLDELLQDLRFAVRALRASPGFAATALLTLALGIGANTAIFSVVRGVLLKELPFRQPDRVVRIWHAHRINEIERGAVSEPDFLDWRAQSEMAESMGGYFFADGLSGLDLTGSGDPEWLSVALVTDGFFETLGTPAVTGRSLRSEEHVAGQDRSVVISHGFWTRRFGGDPSFVGRTVTLNDEPFQVVGIMPPGFTYPADCTIDAWIPLSFFGPDDIGRSRAAQFLGVIARMKAGVTEPQLKAELGSIVARLSREHPENPGWDDVTIASIRESMLGEVRQPLTVLMVAVSMLLLVACVNIASLLLARATGRRQELAVRAALGAGRWRVARQLLTESLTLALLGGVLGIAFGFAAVRVLATASASELPRAGDIGVDATVLAFTLTVSILSGLLFGIVPAMRASSGLQGSLRAGARGTVGGAGQKLRSALVVAEVALAVILVVGAGLATNVNAVRQAIWSQDPSQTITSLTTLESVLGTAVARPRLMAWLLALFGAIGLTLGALGIFGVLAYAVNQRRQEIGLRVALGAPPRAVLRLVVRQGMLLAATGVATGVAAALLLTRWMQGVLFDIRPSDPMTFIQMTVVLMAAALLASWLPARLALAIDPVSALRYD
ncbi:MAG: ABC transporter permease [Gemmatimonadota bacterium]|nr:ABC transporter permease [Gemmatimonadota bacterium]